MQINFSKLFCLTVMIPSVISSVAMAQQGSKSLDEDDTSGNSYIEDALSDLPATPPSVDNQHNLHKEVLIKQREDAQSRLTVELPQKSSINKPSIPQIESASKVKNKDSQELYELLSRQTGLGEKEIEALFKGEKKTNDTESESVDPSLRPAP